MHRKMSVYALSANGKESGKMIQIHDRIRIATKI